MEEGDWEANFAYYALLKLHILPSVFLNMDELEKAFVVAAIKVKMEDDRKKEKEMKRKTKAGKKGR
ncbi:MAG: hypothetical protein K2P73_04015 [Lachnospiraceae bacterium]|nr:hypothetical protein [Lachnospiraceae bacterium]